MRIPTLAVAITLCAASFGQVNTLPADTLQPIDLRLDMASDEFRKAARDRNTSIYVLLAGAAMVFANESQRDGAKYDESLSWWLGGAAFGATITLQLTGNAHEKRGSLHLHQ